MDRKRRSNCAALRAVLIFLTFVSYFVYHRLPRAVSSHHFEPLIKCRKIANAVAILGDNVRSSFSLSQKLQLRI